MQLEDSHFLIGKLTRKQQSSRQSVTGIRVDIQINRTEMRVQKLTHSQVILGKGAKTIQLRRNTVFNKHCWDNWTATSKRMKWDPYLTPSTKIKSKWIIKDLHIRPGTIKPLEVNIGRKFLHICLYQTK